VIEELRLMGVAATAVELPYTSFEDDVTATRQAVRAASGPVLLVGHSLGGGVVCAASDEPAVRRLGFVSALVLEPGQTLANRLKGFGVPDAYAGGSTPELAAGLRVGEDGWVSFDPQLAPAIFFGDCPPGDAAEAAARLRPASASSMSGVPLADHRRLPSSFVFCTQDQALPVVVQEAFASTLSGPHESLPTSHSPFLSRPTALAGIVRGWAAA
jgi:pimeloyl-ACP methyl ester carboxylesterase